MDGMIPARAGKLVGAILTAVMALAVAAGAASAETEVVYNSLPSPTPANLASQPFEAAQTAEFGGLVELGGTARRNGAVQVGMSTWACQKGNWTGTPECLTEAGARYEMPITLNLYEVEPSGAVGKLVTSVTKVQKLPYRPRENRFKCLNGKGEPSGAYYSKGQCFHGKYFKLSFPVGRITWPSKVIISVAYNTSNYGAAPYGTQPCDSEPSGCYYDSLNVALIESPEAPTVGSDPAPNDAYQNTLYAPNYCDGGLGGTGTFRLDAGCWAGYQPALQVKAIH
jgi:hypothetical protein